MNTVLEVDVVDSNGRVVTRLTSAEVVEGDDLELEAGALLREADELVTELEYSELSARQISGDQSRPSPENGV